MTIANRLAEVPQNIARAAARSGRAAESIQLVAVSKTATVAQMQEALAAGQFIFGENYIQEAQSKYLALGTAAQLHLIGHLQSNKAKIAAEIFTVVQTIDRLKVAQALQNHLEKLGRSQQILVQVNIGNEPQKSGILPQECEQLLRELHHLPNLQPTGLMTIPPETGTAEEARPFFQQLRALANHLQEMDLFHDNARIKLSMGMSGDYMVAVEEGATIVRVGTAIFGARRTIYNGE